MVEAVGPFRSRGAAADPGMRGAPEEVQMGETFIFSETIKDLKTLRLQLYSAAEYFELAYTQEDVKQAVVSNLKEYAVKALVNTVDHLGSISFKVSSLVGQRFDEVAEANLRVSCIQQRTQMSQACMNREGLTQQSLVITAPKYHKRYILPGNDSIPDAVPNFSEMNKVKNRTTQMHPAFSTTSAAQTKSKDKQTSFRKIRSIARAPSQRARSSSPAQHTRFVPPSDTAIPTKRDKRSDSPISSTTPLTRSGSLSKKPSLLKTSSVRVQTTSDPKRLAPLRSYADRYKDDPKENEQTPKKSKKFLKSLLSRRKSRKEEPMPCYFDDY
ncbi:hypothetical protein CFC21_103575 [Triticum aestivum]|uniref:Uncharacterized protein n=3 Tax=Triticum TaxID=4564 RepID=A0A9R1A446_TRITD|nr:putative protein ABIL2 isoform X2 [Triticum dicoccoides]XP_044430200.1 putative protein ABIL2 isoform X2 [Triticum aestivum]KAF7102438.1 hypothetical protein CFC21_103575 [Triticum aestivum]VAI89165.1 unnamed protein product [Triticum turgidum subsp. durum]